MKNAQDIKTLADLKIDEVGYVDEISTDDISDTEKKHLMALGFVKGTKIQTKLIANGGNPKAYQIRGITIAIRNTDAKKIILK